MATLCNKIGKNLEPFIGLHLNTKSSNFVTKSTYIWHFPTLNAHFLTCYYCGLNSDGHDHQAATSPRNYHSNRSEKELRSKWIDAVRKRGHNQPMWVEQKYASVVDIRHRNWHLDACRRLNPRCFRVKMWVIVKMFWIKKWIKLTFTNGNTVRMLNLVFIWLERIYESYKIVSGEFKTGFIFNLTVGWNILTYKTFCQFFFLFNEGISSEGVH